VAVTASVHLSSPLLCSVRSDDVIVLIKWKRKRRL
jgi:hypothetical protein